MRYFLIVLLLLPVTSFAAKLPTYDNPHPILAQAITRGSAEGILVGEIDEHFTRQFNSTGTLHVSAKKIEDLPRQDCKRLEVVFTKKNVETPKGVTDAILTSQLNYCLDGGPPPDAQGRRVLK